LGLRAGRLAIQQHAAKQMFELREHVSMIEQQIILVAIVSHGAFWLGYWRGRINS
jgi:hypothetical protein